MPGTRPLQAREVSPGETPGQVKSVSKAAGEGGKGTFSSPSCLSSNPAIAKPLQLDPLALPLINHSPSSTPSTQPLYVVVPGGKWNSPSILQDTVSRGLGTQHSKSERLWSGCLCLNDSHFLAE